MTLEGILFTALAYGLPLLGALAGTCMWLHLRLRGRNKR